MVEDEVSGQELLKVMLQNKLPECKIVGVADNVTEAVQLINKSRPNLVFMDVQLKGGTGFEVLDALEKFDMAVIFVTAYNNYAIRALKTRALDYLLKPLNSTEFDEAVVRIREQLAHLSSETSFIAQSLAVKTASGTEYIKFRDILFFEAQGAYTKIQFVDKAMLSAKNIGEYESILDGAGFFRCHHSYLVNMSHIDKFSKGRNGMIYLSKGYKVPVSQRKMKSFVGLLRRALNKNTA